MPYETTKRIDTSELSDERKIELAKRWLHASEGSAAELLKTKYRALRGDADPTPRTITTEIHGDSPADALGRMYRMRDKLETQDDIDVEADLTGVEYILPSTTFYQVELTINGGR